MKFTELLTPQTIRQGMISSSKKRVFESIARIVDEQLQMEHGEKCCFDCLFNREKLGNSGLGGGVAMPKGRLPQGTKAVGVFIQLESAIDYDAADKRDVDLIFAVLVPENICDHYVHCLPKLTEHLTDKSLSKQLRTAKSEDEIWQIFLHHDQCEGERVEPTELEIPTSIQDASEE